MKTLKRFAGASWPDKVLLIKAFSLLFAIRIGLYVLPLSALRKMALNAHEKTNATRYSVGRIVWAVQSTSRFVPRATCLTQALVAQRLLTQSGHSSSIKIGVAKDDGKGFQSHAWVTCGEHIVIGGPDVDQYASLLTWEKQ